MDDFENDSLDQEVELDFPKKIPETMSGAERRALRAEGHHLKPIVLVGHQGVTDALVQATMDALADHELIKVSISSEAPESRKEAAALLADRAGAHLVQVLGRTCLLYRQNLENDSNEE